MGTAPVDPATQGKIADFAAPLTPRHRRRAALRQWVPPPEWIDRLNRMSPCAVCDPCQYAAVFFSSVLGRLGWRVNEGGWNFYVCCFVILVFKCYYYLGSPRWEEQAWERLVDPSATRRKLSDDEVCCLPHLPIHAR